MRRLLILIPIFLAGAASAAADIVDVRELGNGHQPDVFILFDDTPAFVGSRINGRVIELDIAAPLNGPRHIEPVRSRWISSIETLTRDGQQTVRLELVDGAEGIQIVRTQTGLRLTWTPIESGDISPVMAEVEPVAENNTSQAVVFADETAAEPAETSASLLVSASSDTPIPETGTARHDDELEQASVGADECASASAALEIDSWNIDALTVAASCHLDAGETQEAITMLERVIAFEPGRFEAVIALAEANEAVGNVEAARLLYEQAAMVAATDGQAVAARARARRLTN